MYHVSNNIWDCVRFVFVARVLLAQCFCQLKERDISARLLEYPKLTTK
jgi:hypothetical protein